MTKTFLVTGASTGIGEACALLLDREGHRVFAGVRKDEDGERLRSKASDRLVPVLLDVTDGSQADAVAKRIEAEAGALHGLVNNAGIALGGPIEFLPLEEWRDQFEVNVFGQLIVTRAMMPLIRQSQGRIVFMGSMSGRVAIGLLGPYAASKFALEAIGEALRQELHPWGLRVSVIEPGAVKTPVWDKARATADRLELAMPEEAGDLYEEHILALRKGIEMSADQGVPAEKVAQAVKHALFARRPKTRYVIGLDGRIQSAMVRLLPDRAREAVLRRFVRP